MPIYNDDENAQDPVYNEQDGSGEQVPEHVYVNLQDGNGEQLVWERIIPPNINGFGLPNIGDTYVDTDVSVDDMGNLDEVDYWPAYRKTGTSEWQYDSSERITSTGDYSEAINTLEPETEYEFRAELWETSGGDAPLDTSVILTNTTEPSVVVLDDFEWGGSETLSDHYTNVDGFTVQSSTVIEGSYTLEGTGTYERMGHSSVTLSDRSSGTTYVGRVRAGASDAHPCVLFYVQDAANAIDDAYWFFIEPDSTTGGRVSLYENGSRTDGWDVSCDVSVGVDYDLRCSTNGKGDMTFAVHETNGDERGTELGSVTISDSTHSGGTFGFYNESNTPCYFDWIREP